MKYYRVVALVRKQFENLVKVADASAFIRSFFIHAREQIIPLQNAERILGYLFVDRRRDAA